MPALAHTATSGGPNTEILLLGVGMIVLGVVFFVQKSASRRASVVLLVLGAAAITGAFTFTGSSGDEHHDDVVVEITSPRDGATVEAGTVSLEVAVTGAELASEAEDGGHLHVLVDGETVGMPDSADLEVELDPGEHEIEVEYVGSDHASLDPPVTDSVTVTAE